MYDVPNYYLVDNPIDRYSIGDRTRGLVADDDGGITIALSHARPADERAATNSLPAPPGDFRPMLRVYMPDEALFNGRYTPPAIIRAE